jgi:hypothetical protein
VNGSRRTSSGAQFDHRNPQGAFLMTLPANVIVTLTADPTVAGFAAMAAGLAGVDCLVTRDPDYLTNDLFRGRPAFVGAELAPVAALLINSVSHNGFGSHAPQPHPSTDWTALVTISEKEYGAGDLELAGSINTATIVKTCSHLEHIDLEQLALISGWIRSRL